MKASENALRILSQLPRAAGFSEHLREREFGFGALQRNASCGQDHGPLQRRQPASVAQRPRRLAAGALQGVVDWTSSDLR